MRFIRKRAAYVGLAEKGKAMNKYDEMTAIPVFTERVWRTYLGGRLIDRLHGKPTKEQEDGHFPEEWITSLVAARNSGRAHVPEEGLSLLEDGRTLKSLIMSAPERYLGEEHVNKYGADTGVLIKLLDSSERLTIQVHPNREKAGQLFHSAYGKTEAWYILGGRSIDGRPPCVYLGFKEGITKAEWIRLFERQDFEAMLDRLHCFPVKPGDIILIEGGIPHAIGAGCFLAEIQEPTDYTIRVERKTPAGFCVEDTMCHQGLGFEKMFECFDYTGRSEEETKKRWFLNKNQTEEQPGGTKSSIIRYEDTEFFKMDLLMVEDQFRLSLEPVFSSIYVVSGGGWMEMNGVRMNLSAGKQFFLPARTRQIDFYCSDTKPLQMLHCFGPK